MKVILTGATGMIGNLILAQCLESDQINQVVSISRRSSGVESPKHQEILHEDFSNLSGLQAYFGNVDCVYFCLGVYTGQVSDVLFKQITYDYVVEFSRVLKEKSPKASFCLLSGQGADQTERSNLAFAKYKGMAENHLLTQCFNSTYLFRPAYIYPVTKRNEPNIMYKISRVLYPLIKLLGKNASIKSTDLAKAMFLTGINGAPKTVLENRDILDLVN